MKKAFKAALIVLLFLAGVAVVGLYIATHDIAVLNPKGMIGIKEKDLIITSLLLMLIVVVPVFVLTLAFAWRYRASNTKATHAPDWEHNTIAEYCWWGVPMIIIVVLAILTYRSSFELNPFKPIDGQKRPLTIQVVALQWKWLFIYPEQGIATINFVQFPEKTPLNFEITSDAPMNSFWIPRLGGQIYAMPAMRTKLHLIADEVGDFRGSSANISGSGFAGMAFTARSSTEQEFESWVATVKKSKEMMTIDVYNQLVEPTSYVPPAYYRLSEEGLFDWVVMKYMMPQEGSSDVR